MRSRRNSAGSLRPEPVAEDDVLGELSINGVLASAAEGDETMDLASSSPVSDDGTPAVSGTGTPAEDDTPSRATTTPMAIGARPAPSRQDTSASLAQTPMNDIFLSTLVLDPATPTSSNTHTHETPGGSAAGSSLRVTPEIPEEPAAEERAARLSTEPGHPRDSAESNQYLLLAD